jgi:hypothetical protein
MVKRIELLLEQILFELKEIKKNTMPVVNIPTVWITPNDGTDDSGDWQEQPYTICTGGTACGCPACQSLTIATNDIPTVVKCFCDMCTPGGVAGGCAKCGCKNIAIFTEDGNWWCNKCHRNVYE